MRLCRSCSREAEVTQVNGLLARAKRLLKKSPSATQDLQAALALLVADAFHPTLKTHQLKGEMAGRWACSAGYDLRVIFKFVEHEGEETILLLSAGTHDEVY